VDERNLFFTKNAFMSAASGRGLGDAKEVAAIEGVKIAKEGGARLWVVIGCKDGAVLSCDEEASASLVRFFLLPDDFAAITGVKIAKEGGVCLWVIIGCKDGAILSCDKGGDKGASASLLNFFLSDDFVPSDDVFLIL
jgi:hypothetical protein